MQAMAAVLTETRAVSLPGFDKVWKITKAADTATCDEAVFVRLEPTSWTLKQLVLEKNTNVPKRAPTSLTASLGLENLRKLRNEAQALLLNPPSSCSKLFEVELAEVHAKKKSRTSRSAMQAARHEAASIEVEINVNSQSHTVQVLRPVHPRDHVFVKFSPDNINSVISYLRQEGFADSTSLMNSSRDPAVPAGIWRKSDSTSFEVVYRKEGKRSFKRCSDIDAAITWQANNIDVCTAQGPDDDLHDEPGADGGLSDDEAESIEKGMEGEDTKPSVDEAGSRQ